MVIQALLCRAAAGAASLVLPIQSFTATVDPDVLVDTHLAKFVDVKLAKLAGLGALMRGSSTRAARRPFEYAAGRLAEM
jgi:hypothetical protein